MISGLSYEFFPHVKEELKGNGSKGFILAQLLNPPSLHLLPHIKKKDLKVYGLLVTSIAVIFYNVVMS